jgi:hypothetical protein
VFRQPTLKIDLDVGRHQPTQKMTIFYIIQRVSDLMTGTKDSLTKQCTLSNPTNLMVVAGLPEYAGAASTGWKSASVVMQND